MKRVPSNTKYQPALKKYHGFDYELVKQTETKSIYRQKRGGLTTSYEVFIRKYVDNYKKIENLIKLKTKNKLFKLSDEEKKNILPWVEEFPNDEDFGRRAWSLPNLILAEQWYEKIITEDDK